MIDYALFEDVEGLLLLCWRETSIQRLHILNLGLHKGMVNSNQLRLWAEIVEKSPFRYHIFFINCQRLSFLTSLTVRCNIIPRQQLYLMTLPQ